MTKRQLNVHFDLDGNSGRGAELFGRTSPSSMRVYDLIDRQGRPFVTEVVRSIGRNAICHVIQQIPISTILRGPRFLSWFQEEQFCEFDVSGQRFVVEEPFGDNSRYWIGTDPPGWCAQIDDVRDVFLNALDAIVLGAFGLWRRFRLNP